MGPIFDYTKGKSRIRLRLSSFCLQNQKEINVSTMAAFSFIMPLGCEWRWPEFEFPDWYQPGYQPALGLPPAWSPWLPDWYQPARPPFFFPIFFLKSAWYQPGFGAYQDDFGPTRRFQPNHPGCLASVKKIGKLWKIYESK